MKIHEYQGKEILQRFGIIVPRGKSVISVHNAVQAASELFKFNKKCILKAQIHAGGRGKSGGIRIAYTIDEVANYAKQMFDSKLKTSQTDINGKKINCILIEECIDFKKELYIGVIIDRILQKPVIIVSSKGGINIEEIAINSPESIYKIAIDPIIGLTKLQANDLLKKMKIPNTSQSYSVISGLYNSFWETDALLAEINPLILDKDNKLVALDAKFNFDTNALYRQPKISIYRDLKEENLEEIEASKFDLSYISLNGNIGCLVNGAGLAMATMDAIKLFGGEPANFLDVGGSATLEKITIACKLLFNNTLIKAILINIFGGIVRCDLIAKGLIAASNSTKLRVPLIIRMKGTNDKIAKDILISSNIPIILEDSMESAAKKVVMFLN